MDEHDTQDPNQSGVAGPDGTTAERSQDAAPRPEEASPDAMGAATAAPPTDERLQGTATTPQDAADLGTAPDFQQLQEQDAPGQAAPLSVLFDLDLPVAIELGRTRMSVQDVLALARGSVVQLDRQAGEPVDVFVGDKRFAEAEVVIVGEQFGVRITRLVNNAGLAAVAG